MAADNEQRTIEIILKAQDANASIKDMAAGAAVMTAQLRRMGADDPGRAALLADLQAMNQRLRDANAETRAVVKTQEQLAAEAVAAAAAVEELARANEQTVATGQQATASLNQMRAAATLMERELASLSADDPGRARLQQDFAALTQRIGATTAAMRTQVQTEEELRQAAEQLAAEQVRVVVNGQRVEASFDDMRGAAAQLERQLGQLSADDPGRAQLLADYRALQERIGDVRAEMGATVPQASLFKQALGFAGVALTAEAAVEGVLSIGKGIFETTAKFETFGVVLKTALGSESAAQLAMHDIQTMAANTPFSVDELTSSFIKFVNRGLKPSMADLTKLADLAASQGKSFDQLTEAVLDAGTGEFERLKEFGIQASKSGDQVSLSFKGTQQVVANTPEAINAALLSFGELNGVMGSTAGISKTLEGSVSNLGDTADQVAIQYGNVLRPVFVAVISVIGTFLGLLAALPKFIYDNRAALLGLGVALVTLNSEQVILNGLVLYNTALEKGRAIATRASAAAQWLLNAAMTANPIGLVVAAVALLVGGFITLYERSEKVRAVVAGLGAAFMAFITTLKDGVLQQLSGIGDILVGIFTGSPEKIKAGLVAMGGSLKTIYYDAGRNAGAAFSQGYGDKLAADQQKHVGATMAMIQQQYAKLLKAAEEASKKRIAAEAAARLESLKTAEADLKVRLAQVEDGSRAELKLKQQLIAVQARIELEDTKKTENEKRVIRAEAQDKIQDLEREFTKKQVKEREEQRKKLAKLAEDAAKEELQIQQNIENLRVGLIKDKYDREIADINLQTDRKMAAIKGSEEQQFEQWWLLEQERQEKIAAVEEARAAEKASREKEKRDAWAEEQTAADELHIAELDNMMANGLIAEQAYQDALYEIKRQALESQLALLVANGEGETIEAKRLRTALLKAETDYAKNHASTKKVQDTALMKDALAMSKITRALQDDDLNFLMDTLDKKGLAYMAFKNIRKTAELAEVGINLAAEIQAIWKAANENPLNGVSGGAVGMAQGALHAGMAIARAAAAGIKIAAFAEGGRTDQLVNLVPSAMLAGLLSGASGGSFAGGGVVPGPQLGLIGEAGAELVIPNWLFTDPKQANLMGYLEAQIASRGNAFAEGGRTVDRGVVPGPAVADTESGAVLVLLERIAKGQEDFREEISTWQREQQVRLDLFKVREGLDTMQQVKTGGGLK